MAEPTLIFIIDAFTQRYFAGNPAGVCLSKELLKEERMQEIAREINLSETAFVVPLDLSSQEDIARFHIRWFTPEVEVPLCGHATLSTAHVLFNELGLPQNKITFETLKRGDLYIQKSDDFILMDFPQGRPEPIRTIPEVINVLDITDYKVVEMNFCPIINKLLIELESPQDVLDLKPDFTKMRQLREPENIRGIIVTSKSEKEKYDFISRHFAPWVGVNEDPVTGSAHTILGVYWKRKLQQDEFRAYQASSRGGEIKIRIKSSDRIELAGQALTIIKGRITIPPDSFLTTT
ncbi:MAG: PhzF family phenazine biosynthesis protein [Candidatus Hodarchaeota archaeon]